MIIKEKFNTLYKGDYDAKTWEECEKSLDDSSFAKLNPTLKNNTYYDFQDDVTPFAIISGEKIVDPEINLVAKDGKYGKAFRVDTVLQGEDNVAEVVYRLAKPLANKEVDFMLYDCVVKDSVMKCTVGNEQNNITLMGYSDFYYAMYKTVDGKEQEVINTLIRRKGQQYSMAFDFTTGNGLDFYMDERLVAHCDEIKDFDLIKISVVSPAKSNIMVDKLHIIEKNPITKFNIPKEKVTFGYYDTYEISLANTTIETLYPYKTTDRLTYWTDDSNIATVSLGGSIRGINFGTTTAHIKGTAGATSSIEVNYVDIQAEKVFLTDSFVYDKIEDRNVVTKYDLDIKDKVLLNPTIVPEGTTKRAFEWKSSDESIVTVCDGIITPVAYGTAIVTATLVGTNLCASCEVIVCDIEKQYGLEVFVDSKADSAIADGSFEKPFATIEDANTFVKANLGVEGGIKVSIRGGEYFVAKGFNFNKEFTGTANSPICYCGYKDEKVVLRGSVKISTKDFVKVSEKDNLAQIRDEVKDKIYVVDLKKYGITNRKELQFVGHSTTMTDWLIEEGKNLDNPYYCVLCDSKDMTLARFPNEGEGTTQLGFAKITEIVHEGAVPRHWADDTKGKSEYVEEKDRDTNDVFSVKSEEIGDRYKLWQNEKEGWMLGYWKNEFSDQATPIRKIFDDGTLQSEEPSVYGIGPHGKFFVYNMLSELDSPNEWFIDQDEFKLYFYPPVDVEMSDNHTVEIPVLDSTMFNIDEANYIEVRNVQMVSMLKSAVEITAGKFNKISHCGIMSTRKRAIQISNVYDENDYVAKICQDNVVEYCTLQDINGGIGLSGGDRATLEKGRNIVKFCKIDNFSTVIKSYNPAFEILDVGNVASACEISTAPHNAIIFRGNDHIMEYLDIHDVVLQAGDQSAIYTGRDITAQGEIIRKCHIHNVGNPINAVENSAIYFDDMSSGYTVIDNLIEDVHWGIFVNGGRDTKIIGNTFNRVDAGCVGTNWGYCHIYTWDTHAYGLYNHPLTMKPIVYDWSSENSPYRKYNNLLNTLIDGPNESKYNSYIDNVMVESNCEDKHFFVSNRKVAPNGEEQVGEWYFQKNNTIKKA